jgi:spore coat polysaccharide biosynthesis protein SpsF (cytidylyltransferase family)
MTMDSLRRAYEIAETDRLREHPTLAFYENPEKFKMRLIPAPEKWNRPQWRFTVDTETDLKLVESILQNLGIDATLDRIVPFLDSNSAIAGMNSDVAQAGWRTLKEQKDRIGHV